MFVLMTTVLLNGACRRVWRHTVELKCHLYVEDFDVNLFGVDEVYLTDSTSFRIYIGKYDVEHERLSFECAGDSVIIYKGTNKDGTWADVDNIHLARKDLSGNKLTHPQPLFEFK